MGGYIRTLIVGDPHLDVRRLDDNRVFLDKIIELSNTHEATIILGDCFNNFAVIRSEILNQWNYFFNFAQHKVICLVGNHDYAGQQGGSHALSPFHAPDRDVWVVDDWTKIGDAYYAPFMRDDKAFEAKCKEIPNGSVLFCHQSFLGARFSSGFEDPNGANAECVKHLSNVISGHIHTNQRIQNVWYPGTPYQNNFGEAGEKKRVFTIDLQPNDYKIVEEHDLGLPEFVVFDAESIDKVSLGEPNPRSFYKVSSKGSPAEIAAFWADPKTKAFREKTRRMVDAVVADRGQVILPGSKVGTKMEKLDEYIKSQKWTTPTDTLCDAARVLFFRPSK